LANSGLVVHGYSRLKVIAKKAGPEVQKDLDRRLLDLAEPIRADAEALAASGIRRIGPRWSQMRVGVTRRVVYVAPRQRGVKTRGPDPRRRPKFADLLERRAMEPALERNKDDLEQGTEDVLYGFASRWNRI
jgi:hypothetical protein